MVIRYPIFLKGFCFDSLQFSQEFFVFADNEAPIKHMLWCFCAMNEKKRLGVLGHIVWYGFEVDLRKR